MSGTRASRLATYVRRMFPPAVMIPSGVGNAVAIHASLSALAGVAPRITPRLGAASATVVLVMLLLRVYDELKDAASDAARAAEGDARFRDRPLVRGEVTVADLESLKRWLLVLLVALNLPLGAPWPLLAFVAVLVVTGLSRHWFFWPAISRSLLLAFATHNPMSLVVSAYVAAVWARDAERPLPEGAIALLVGLWAPVAAWEISRKLRMPEEETAYTTYSRVLGLRPAAAVAGSFVALSLACLGSVAARAGLWPAASGILVAASLPALGGSLALAARPTSRGARTLRPLVELQAIGATVAMIAGSFAE